MMKFTAGGHKGKERKKVLCALRPPASVRGDIKMVLAQRNSAEVSLSCGLQNTFGLKKLKLGLSERFYQYMFVVMAWMVLGLPAP